MKKLLLSVVVLLTLGSALALSTSSKLNLAVFGGSNLNRIEVGPGSGRWPAQGHTYWG